MSKYLACCVLRRCGQLDGNEACCKRMKRGQYNIEFEPVTNTYRPIGDRIDMRNIVLDHLWTSIKEENCAQNYKGWCVSHRNCSDKQYYCYPIPLREKTINRTVVVMFAYYCADQAESSAAAATYTADAAAAAAADAATYAAAVKNRDAFWQVVDPIGLLERMTYLEDVSCQRTRFSCC